MDVFRDITVDSKMYLIGLPALVSRLDMEDGR